MELKSFQALQEPKKLIAKPWQQDFILCDKQFPAFVGPQGVGKSLCAIARGWSLSTNYPNNLGVVYRKEFVNLKTSTMRDFQDYTNIDMKLEQREPLKDLYLPNNSTILFRHLDDIDSVKNMTLGWAFIEQAEELETDEIWWWLCGGGRLRRRNVFRTIFLTANACGHNWIWRLWKESPPSANYVLFGENLTTFDNEDNLPPDYIANSRLMEKTKPAMYRRLILNDSDEEDVSDFIMNRQVVEKARDTKVYGRNRRLVSFDPSRLRDEFVIYIFEGARVIDQKFLNPQNYPAGLAMLGAAEVTTFANQYNTGLVAGDSIGLGGPVIERVAELLKGRNIQIKEVNSALPCEKLEPYPTQEEDQKRFLNVRAKMWFYTWEQIEQNKVQVPDDPKLINQLCAVKFKYVKGKYRVEEKEEIKSPKRLGESPDRADAFVQGVWSLQFCPISGTPVDYEDFQFQFKGRKSGY